MASGNSEDRDGVLRWYDSRRPTPLPGYHANLLGFPRLAPGAHGRRPLPEPASPVEAGGEEEYHVDEIEEPYYD